MNKEVKRSDAFWQLVRPNSWRSGWQKYNFGQMCPLFSKCAHILTEQKNLRECLKCPRHQIYVVMYAYVREQSKGSKERKGEEKMPSLNSQYFTHVHIHGHVTQQQGKKLCCLVNVTYQRCGWSSLSCLGFSIKPTAPRGP